MALIQKIGIIIFIVALGIFTLSLGLSDYVLTEESLQVDSEYHRAEIIGLAKEQGILNKKYYSNFAFISAFKGLLKDAQASLNEKAKVGIPNGVDEWNYKIVAWKIKDADAYIYSNTKAASVGILPNNIGLFFWLTFGLGILGGLLYILPKFILVPDINNDGIYHSAMTRGLKLNPRATALGTTIVGVLLCGVIKMNSDVTWPIITALVIGLIYYLVFYKEGQKDLAPAKSASPIHTGWLGVITGFYLIAFYILLYWFPAYLTNWILLVDPLSMFLKGDHASQWFLYGFLYCIAVGVMGIRMIAKYRHNKYQIIRTISVVFFQTCIAFLLPEILLRLNYPYYDFKNIWPLNYTFFFDYNINKLIASGGLGIFMLVWGIAFTIIGVPVITYFFGKRWYCSWVCGCGGLAETLGDPYRQLSDKSLSAWRFERWVIHGVLVFAVVMTLMVLYSYFTGSNNILFFNSNAIRGWYGFLIGAGFAGVVGTGFYPLMGNRIWCRFGCPLAAYLGLVQKYKSRFRITTNGGQCISCGNCSTYCEMGIDVRAYAQRGQDIVRSSCVGCGVCSAVCPRGVLRLENASSDIDLRTSQLRTVHISENSDTFIPIQ